MQIKKVLDEYTYNLVSRVKSELRRLANYHRGLASHPDIIMMADDITNVTDPRETARNVYWADRYEEVLRMLEVQPDPAILDNMVKDLAGPQVGEKEESFPMWPPSVMVGGTVIEIPFKIGKKKMEAKLLGDQSVFTRRFVRIPIRHSGQLLPRLGVRRQVIP